MSNCKVIALTNQKGGVGKTTTAVNLGVSLVQQGKKVLLIDADAQANLTMALGYNRPDDIPITLSTVMQNIIDDKTLDASQGIIHHREGVDLLPSNIELSGFEVRLINAMSRERVLKTYVNEVKKNYDYVLIDCMPSLGMITINALAAADSVIIPTQPHYLSAKGLELFHHGTPLERLNCLNRAAEYVQMSKDMQNRFMGLSRRMKSAYQICYPSGELTDKETATAQFYLAIRSIIYKQTKGDAPDAEVMNSIVEEMVKEAITCTGIENIVDEHKSVDLFSDDFLAELDTVKMPITKFNALLKLLRKAISAYGRTNKVKAIEFDERLKEVVDAYNSRDKLVFTSEVVADFVNDLSDQLLKILNDLKADKSSFEQLGITYEEKAFYDILVKVRDDHGFPYADEKCLVLAKKIKELVDDKSQFADWSTRDDIKNQLNMDLTVLLYKNGYPPEWDEEVFEKVMEQAENFKKYSD